jgi:hypothetical protein
LPLAAAGFEDALQELGAGFVAAAFAAGEFGFGFDEAAFDGGFEDGGFVALEVGLDALEVGDGFVEAGELFFDFRDDRSRHQLPIQFLNHLRQLLAEKLMHAAEAAFGVEGARIRSRRSVMPRLAAMWSRIISSQCCCSGVKLWTPRSCPSTGSGRTVDCAAPARP